MRAALPRSVHERSGSCQMLAYHSRMLRSVVTNEQMQGGGGEGGGKAA